MECEKIRHLLSGYIDGVLDAGPMALVREHLSSCKDCEQALGSLQTLVQELGDMEHIKAPDDFLDQVHARTAKRFNLSVLMKTLLIPFRVSLPYRFATAAAMAILIFIIIHTPEIEKEMPGIPTRGERHEPTEVTDSDGLLGRSRVKEANPPGPIKRRPVGHDLEEQTVPASREITSPTVVLKQKKVAAKPKSNEPASIGEAVTIKTESKFAMGKAVIPVEIVLLLKPAVPMRNEFPQNSYATDTVPAPEKGQSQGLRSSGAGRAAPMYSSRIMKKDSSKEEPSGSPAEEALKQIETPVSGDLSRGSFHSSLTAVISSIQGSISSTEYDKETGKPKFVNTEIPAEQYGIFCERLLRFGALQSPPPAIEAGCLEPIRIRIHLVHP